MLGDSAAIYPLMDALKHNDSGLRREAAKASCSIWAILERCRLLSEAWADQHSEVYTAVTGAVSAMGYAALKILAQVLHIGKDYLRCCQATWALDGIDHPGAVGTAAQRIERQILWCTAKDCHRIRQVWQLSC